MATEASGDAGYLDYPTPIGFLVINTRRTHSARRGAPASLAAGAGFPPLPWVAVGLQGKLAKGDRPPSSIPGSRRTAQQESAKSATDRMRIPEQDQVDGDHRAAEDPPPELEMPLNATSEQHQSMPKI